MSHDHHPDKKLKKLALLFKNRRHLHINQQAAVHERNRELDREREEKMQEAALASSRAGERKNAPKQDATFRKLDEIRNKNTHRSRLAAERWNRFAGTEAGGGRGL